MGTTHTLERFHHNTLAVTIKRGIKQSWFLYIQPRRSNQQRAYTSVTVLFRFTVLCSALSTDVISRGLWASLDLLTESAASASITVLFPVCSIMALTALVSNSRHSFSEGESSTSSVSGAAATPKTDPADSPTPLSCGSAS